MRRGFTLIEISYVITVIGLLATISVPSYRALLHRAHASEARAVLHAIAHAELQHLRDRGSYLACPATGDIPRGPATFPGEEACWRALSIRPEGEVYYRYGVTVADGTFEVTAEGDLDHDGVIARYRLSGRDLHLDVVDGLE